MRKVCRKGRPAPAQTAGSHHSEKTELLVWHFPRTRPFPRLPFSVGKLETPSGDEDPVITGALRKLRSLLLPNEQNTDYLQNELAPEEPLCRCLATSWLTLSGIDHFQIFPSVSWSSAFTFSAPPRTFGQALCIPKIRQGTTHFWSKVLPSKRKNPEEECWFCQNSQVPVLKPGTVSPRSCKADFTWSDPFSLVHLFVYSFIHLRNMSDEYTHHQRESVPLSSSSCLMIVTVSHLASFAHPITLLIHSHCPHTSDIFKCSSAVSSTV